MLTYQHRLILPALPTANARHLDGDLHGGLAGVDDLGRVLAIEHVRIRRKV